MDTLTRHLTPHQYATLLQHTHQQHRANGSEIRDAWIWAVMHQPLIGLLCLLHSDGTVTVDYDPSVPPGVMRTERLQYLS